MGIFGNKPAEQETSLVPDALDELQVVQLEENPDAVEQVVKELQQEAPRDEGAAALLAAIYYDADRAASFERYYQSRDFEATVHLLDLFGISPQARIIEVGAGPGFLASALNRRNYRIEILEPSRHWNSGTGYLRTRESDRNIAIHSDHVAWHAAAAPYDLILTKNCLHHFQNITQVAVSLRQKLKPGGWWIAIREWFADDARELAAAVARHPFRLRNPKIYEWPYPAHHYAESLELAGLRLHAVVPAGYANNCLGAFSEEPGSRENAAFTAKIDRLLAKRPERTVDEFWREVKKNRFEGGTCRTFTRPQVMVFRKDRV
jgi:2-polyprenyl-3-methyl-5-hydroxy-6-metoxy-1,4-benzoquinol methylase